MLPADGCRTFALRRRGVASMLAASCLPNSRSSADEASLRGEALFRELRFDDAIEAFREAVTADTLFALAWWRMSKAWGWTGTGGSEGHDALLRAAALASDLPTRERVLVRADTDLLEGSNASIPSLRSHLARHPEDADAWSWLGEFATHAPWLSMAPAEEAESSIARAVDLLPSFSPYYIHLIGLMMAEGREPEFQEYVRRVRSMNPRDAYLVAWQPAWDFSWGDPEQMRVAETFLRSLPLSQRLVVHQGTHATDAAIRVWASMDLFPRGFYDQAFPYMSSAVSGAAGIGPDQWEVRQAPGLLRWALLVGSTKPALSELSEAVARGPTTA
jgi:tetratricopeptide (TPR) repeat protein